MARRMRISSNGLELIKSFEGFHSRSVERPDGGWMIGYGHTAAATENQKVSEAEAELILRHHDLAPVEAVIAALVHAPLTQNEFDALVSFVFNIGTDAFAASDVLRRLNEGDRIGAADAILPWRKARTSGDLRTLEALVRRRAAEAALFLEHPEGRVALPTALVQAELDTLAAGYAQRPAAVVVETGSDFEPSPANQLRRGVRESEAAEAGDAPQAAARAVTERLRRILGENAALASGEDGPPPDPNPQEADPQTNSDGVTVDEITRAISALADPDDERAGGESVADQTGARSERAALPHANDLVIDDLQSVEIDETERAQAVRAYDRFEASERTAVLLEWLPFALLCILGVLGLFYGLRGVLSPSTYPEAIADAARPGHGPVLMLGGGVLFMISAYYLARGVFRRD